MKSPRIRIILALGASAVAALAVNPLAGSAHNATGHAVVNWRTEGLPGPPTFSARVPADSAETYAVLPAGCAQAACATTETLTSVATTASAVRPDVATGARTMKTPDPPPAVLASAIRAARNRHPMGKLTLLVSRRELHGAGIVSISRIRQMQRAISVRTAAKRLPVIHFVRTGHEHSCLPTVFGICVGGYSEFLYESFYTHGDLVNGRLWKSWKTEPPACWPGSAAGTSTNDIYCRWFSAPARGRHGRMYAKNRFSVSIIFRGFPITITHWQQYTDTADGGAYYFAG